MKKFVFLTDTHLFPWNRRKIVNIIKSSEPAGVFLTGDVSHLGLTFLSDIEFLGENLEIPIYFVYGNHDLWLYSFRKIKDELLKLSRKYSNLFWMTDHGVISLNEEEKVGLIGGEGWYSATLGNPEYIKYTFDWFLIKEFVELKNWEERLYKFKQLSRESALILGQKLESALENHDSVYLLTHFPPWAEAGRYDSLISEKFWEPYNTNFYLGQTLEKIMESHPDKKLVVLSGHTHSATQIRVSQNIECRVGRAGYFTLSKEEILFI